MKAIILSGGRGTRLRPLTHTQNKQAIPIANKPMILYPFESIVNAGIKEIGIIVNETREEIENILGDGSKWGVKITYIFQDHPGGLAHALSLAEDFIGDSRFVMVLGDNLMQDDLKTYVNKFNNEQLDGMILGIKVPLEEHKRYGMATLDKDQKYLLRYIEKPGVVDDSPLYNPETSYAVPGFYFFDSKVFGCFKGTDKIKPSARGELEIASAYNWLVQNSNKVGFSVVKGWTRDPGKRDDLLSVNRLILSSIKTDLQSPVEESTIDGLVQIGKNTKIINSEIRGPVIIGDNCLIENVYLGPYTAVSDNCVVQKSEIENSIVMNASRIIDVNIRIDSSLIGYNSLITNKKSRPNIISLFVGDNSEVFVPEG